MSYLVYILKCSDNSYYVGITNNVEKRVWEHNQGIVRGYTFKRKPVRLVYFQEFKDVNEAIAFEKQLKGWRRVKKEALINKNIDKLKKLTKGYNSHPSSSSG
ncbi:hypothetical protein COY13_04515 [Candidatus Roizmanbacteria bacterium CG_4_10_14_0_2_um_filter_36_35]|uniref:GIY-YIG domain-containing protein n=5 Tax=Candidatus Roizmaniibacteriota TaxID=1752723 RepID=A0A2M7BX36_9BACT|nr:MAG: hypothetical protein COV86_00500 [Candidatus Roizmanbacteria bacterium CG11_big_fil_rev_8_21_14_0_20_35_14]PIV11137.1 MAG: hypothetical protein COS50_01885 [Candidatus Roizmanbacteria bacterium CG03_land_8_20_14_0_80_35_26]PIZ66919.1 MAG: hypothetical protein COY13_04515 [Candidatus Roizmanbacteria bacterium CG_4_10_14_0_2_um_filter_36_35]PJC33539.1 MAG: hypothetical protein CO049_00380 [Candidatus Roizmanbacteria bacterium CG_4_9_14_0_2_um_filter_36_12]PJC81806.1 MAG: hypothetical prot